MKNDFGLKNVVIKNIENDIKAKRITSHTEITELVEGLKNDIDMCADQWTALFRKINECSHQYSKPTYTIENRVIGYCTVFKRQCKNCGYQETHSVYCDSEDQSCPEWTKDAQQRYFNNFL